MRHGDRTKGMALIPGGHDATSYACLRSLAREGIGTLVASEKDGTPASVSRYCDEFVRLTDPRDDFIAYRHDLLALAKREDVRTILPVRPEDCYLLSRYDEDFSDRISLAVPTLEQLRTVHDRFELVATAEDAGVPVPSTRRLVDVDDWDDDLLIKSRYNVLTEVYVNDLRPDDVAVVKEIYHVANDAPPDPTVIRGSMRHDPIVQEFVHHDGEFMFTGLYDHGEPLSTFQHRQIRGNSYTGGGGVYRKSIYDPELERVGRTLLDHLDWHGLACIEYMRDAETGEYVLTEINPRLWQSLPSTVRAGADFPYYYWLAVTGRADEVDTDYDIGVGSHLLNGEVGYVRSVLTEDSPHVSRPSTVRTLWEIGSSIAREPHFDYLSLDDPGPFFAGIRTVISK